MAKISLDLQPVIVNRRSVKKTRRMTTKEATTALEAAMLAFENWGALARNLELIKISWEDESYSETPLLWLKILIIVLEPDSAEKIEVKVDFRYPRPHDSFSRFEMYWDGRQQHLSLYPKPELDPIILAACLKEAVLSKLKVRVGEIKSRGSNLEKLTAADVEVTV